MTVEQVGGARSLGAQEPQKTPAFTLTIKGLQNGQKYKFTVQVGGGVGSMYSQALAWWLQSVRLD